MLFQGPQGSHRINKVAKLLNISQETLRFYEEKGIITPKRDSENQYRIYNNWDVQTLINARMYRELGFSLEKTSELINEFDLESYKEYLVETESKLYHEIKKLQNMRKLTEETRINISDAVHLKNNFIIQVRPDMYRIDLDVLYREKVKDDDVYWTRGMPFLFQSAVFHYLGHGKQDDKTSLQANKASIDPSHKLGFGLLKKYADYLGVCEDEYIKFYPSTRSIYTVLEVNSEDSYSLDSLNGVFEYLEKYDIQVTGDIITRNLFFKKKEDRYVNYSHIWVPF